MTSNHSLREKNAPISDDDWPESVRDLREGFAGALNVYRVMAHHSELLRAWAPLRQHIVKDSALDDQELEVVILRTGVRIDSNYEWAHHVARARAIGMSDARIRAVRDGPKGEDLLLTDAVDAIIDHHQISDSLDNALVQKYGKEAVFDLIATVGFYRILGTILKTYNVPIDDTVRQELEINPL